MGVVEEAHNVKVLGSGERTIVLGHGFGTDQSVWKHLLPHLVDEYRVVLYDNMGAGPTNPDYFDFDRYASLEGYAYDLLAILEELQIQSCIYVGHSLSSMTGAIASIFRPDLFQKLIMISASPRFINTDDYYGGFEKEEIDQLCNAIEANYKSWCSGFAPLVVGGGHGLGCCSRIQQDLVQHEAGHSTKCVPDHIHVRPQTFSLPRHRPLPYHPKHQGLGHTGGGV